MDFQTLPSCHKVQLVLLVKIAEHVRIASIVNIVQRREGLAVYVKNNSDGVISNVLKFWSIASNRWLCQDVWLQILYLKFAISF